MKLRKAFFLVLMVILVTVLVSCRKKKEKLPEVELEDLILAEEMTHDLGYKASDGYTFEISNEYVASIDENGVLTADLQGDVLIELFQDDTKVSEFNLKVYGKVRNITINGPDSFYTNEIIKYEVSFLPRNGYPFYEFEVEDDNILNIDEAGVITPKSIGTTKIKVMSLQDDVTFDEIEVTVKNVIVVKSNLGSNDTVNIGNWEYEKGLDLFASIEAGISAANYGDKVLILSGNYAEEIAVDKPIILEGDEAVFESTVSVKSSNVSITNISFTNNAKVDVTDELVTSFNFYNNKVYSVESDSFLAINRVANVHISGNEFKDLNNAITFQNLGENIDVLIEKNIFKDLEIPIIINAVDKLSDNALLRVYRNDINGVTKAFDINVSEENEESKATLYTRFNEVINYNKAIVQSGPNLFEHTFNYWGSFDIANFENVDKSMLIGYYEDSSEIIREAAYDDSVPLIVTWDNVIDEIWLGETYDIEVTVIPYSSNQTTIQLQIIQMDLAELEGGKTITPKTSGEFIMRVGSFANMADIKEHKIVVTTDPGIHLEIDNPTQDLTVGKSFNIKGVPFPYDRLEEPVKYTSSDPSVATVTVGGLVEIVRPGEFEITASLLNEPEIKQAINFTAYDELDDEDILDFYTRRQLSYSQVQHITLHGASSHLRIHNESVTRVLADEIESREKIIPVSSGFRPGTLMRSNIPEKFKFNEDNVVWVVVHDTGNSNAGSGAEMHANYLYQAATEGGRQASWHYTIDSHLRYQSLPENEIGYHAGDGSGTGAVPKEDGVSPALGGGNTNGIGIEMSVQRDGDVWKTWQNTAQFSASLLHKYNLPMSQLTYHNDFSGKNCPQTLRRAGLIWLFEEFVQNEYDLIKIFGNSIDNIKFISHNPEILDNTGIIINTPNLSTNVSYTLEVEMGGETLTRTFTTLVEGLWR